MISERLMRLGTWGLALSEDTVPGKVWDLIQEFDHIAVTPSPLDPDSLSDDVFNLARYTGVIRKVGNEARGPEITGVGLAMWLGDEYNKGDVIESPGIQFNGHTFADTIRQLLPASISEGTLYTVAGTYSGKHIWEDRRTAIDFVTETFGAEWRINPDFSLDAGKPEDLFTFNPKTIIARRVEQTDPLLHTLPGQPKTARDSAHFSTRVVVLAEGEGEAIATGAADGSAKGFLDRFGNPVKMTRLVSEAATSDTLADARASSLLNLYQNPRRTVELDLEKYEIHGDLTVGDWVWVWDPSIGFIDPANEELFQGEIINPVALRIVSLSWPLEQGLGVYHRHRDGTWTDLTSYVEWEEGQSQVGVGAPGPSRSRNELGDRVHTPAPAIDKGTTPDEPDFISVETSIYIDDQGQSAAQAIIAWNTPLNTDGSTVTDGSHYVVRVRRKEGNTTDHQRQFVEWGQNQTTVLGLSPGETYVLALGAYNIWGRGALGLEWDLIPTETTWSNLDASITWDTWGSPGNFGTKITFVAEPDTTPPPQPATPVAAGSTLQLMIVHELGVATGGTYNLPLDLNHLEVHLGDASTFIADQSTKIGTVQADASNIQMGVAAIGIFQNATSENRWVKVIAVDNAGNRSDPSEAVQVNSTLIDTAHIANAAIHTAKIANLAVTDAKIADLAVDTAKIKDLAVTNAKIANLAVDNAKIVDLSVDTAKIANLSVTNGKIADLAVTNAKIADLTVTTAKIADLAVDSAKIADLAVTNAKVSSLSADKITAGTMSAARINGGDINGVTITGNTITGGTIRTSSSGDRVEMVEGTYSKYFWLYHAGNSRRINSSAGGLNVFAGTDGGTTAFAGNIDVSNTTFSTKLEVSSTKNFVVPHPFDPTKEVIHSCYEGPGPGGTIYRYRVTTVQGSARVNLPDYFDGINIEVDVHVTAVQHFGTAFGYIEGGILHIKSSEDGEYAVLILGTRNDPAAIESGLQNNGGVRPKKIREGLEELRAEAAHFREVLNEG